MGFAYLGASDNDRVRLRTLARIPVFYLSKKDAFVRSPEYYMKWHARKFSSSKIKKTILSKYAAAGAYTSRQVFLRHLGHVCSWVAELPENEVTESIHDTGLCPLGVLMKLLTNRGHGPLTPRLRAYLERVRQRSKRILESSRLTPNQRDMYDQFLHRDDI